MLAVPSGIVGPIGAFGGGGSGGSGGGGGSANVSGSGGGGGGGGGSGSGAGGAGSAPPGAAANVQVAGSGAASHAANAVNAGAGGSAGTGSAGAGAAAGGYASGGSRAAPAQWSGWVQEGKMGEATWKKRYAVLDAERLVLYKDRTMEKLKLLVPLPEAAGFCFIGTDFSGASYSDNVHGPAALRFVIFMQDTTAILLACESTEDQDALATELAVVIPALKIAARGWLYKRATMRWNRRFCVATSSGDLLYYASGALDLCLGHIPLRVAPPVVAQGQNSPSGFGFEVRRPDGQLELFCIPEDHPAPEAAFNIWKNAIARPEGHWNAGQTSRLQSSDFLATAISKHDFRRLPRLLESIKTTVAASQRPALWRGLCDVDGGSRGQNAPMYYRSLHRKGSKALNPALLGMREDLQELVAAIAASDAEAVTEEDARALAGRGIWDSDSEDDARDGPASGAGMEGRDAAATARTRRKGRDPGLTRNTLGAVTRILTALLCRYPSIRYRPHLRSMASLLLAHLSEQDAFWAFSWVMDRVLDQYFDPKSVVLQLDCIVFEELVAHYMPAVAAWLIRAGLQPRELAFEWFPAMFTQFPMRTAARVWDMILYEGSPALFRIALAVLSVHEQALQRLVEQAERAPRLPCERSMVHRHSSDDESDLEDESHSSRHSSEVLQVFSGSGSPERQLSTGLGRAAADPHQLVQATTAKVMQAMQRLGGLHAVTAASTRAQALRDLTVSLIASGADTGTLFDAPVSETPDSPAPMEDRTRTRTMRSSSDGRPLFASSPFDLVFSWSREDTPSLAAWSAPTDSDEDEEDAPKSEGMRAEARQALWVSLHQLLASTPGDALVESAYNDAKFSGITPDVLAERRHRMRQRFIEEVHVIEDGITSRERVYEAVAQTAHDFHNRLQGLRQEATNLSTQITAASSSSADDPSVLCAAALLRLAPLLDTAAALVESVGQQARLFRARSAASKVQLGAAALPIAAASGPPGRLTRFASSRVVDGGMMGGGNNSGSNSPSGLALHRTPSRTGAKWGGDDPRTGVDAGLAQQYLATESRLRELTVKRCGVPAPTQLIRSLIAAIWACHACKLQYGTTLFQVNWYRGNWATGFAVAQSAECTVCSHGQQLLENAIESLNFRIDMILSVHSKLKGAEETPLVPALTPKQSLVKFAKRDDSIFTDIASMRRTVIGAAIVERAPSQHNDML